MKKIKIQKNSDKSNVKFGLVKGKQHNHRQVLLALAVVVITFVMGFPVCRQASAQSIVTYPAPAGEADSSSYRVEVNGQPVDVYLAKTQHHDKKYYFASFDFSGEVDIRVTSPLSLAKVEILPESCEIKPAIQSINSIMFKVRRPFKVSIERDGENSPLMLFGNPLEENAPKADDLNMIYFGPGIHSPGKISMASNQTLYLAGGAVVKGGIEAKGENIRILGRGILDGSDYPHLHGPTRHMLHLEKCQNVLVKDIILLGSWGWTIVPCGCDRVTIDNVKLCGSRVGNDDGIDPVNSSNVKIHDCFLRTDDDCIAIKGMRRYDNKTCEKIVITDCSFWTDRANVFRIGAECETDAMQDITARNIDVLHFMDDRLPEEFWTNCVFYLQPSDNMPMSRLRFEDFRINAAGINNLLVKMLPMRCKGVQGVANSQTTEESGITDDLRIGRYIKDCYFKDIRLAGKAGGGPGIIYVAGADARHPVENVTFENVVRFGAPTFANSPDVTIGPYTNNIRFLNK